MNRPSPHEQQSGDVAACAMLGRRLEERLECVLAERRGCGTGL